MKIIKTFALIAICSILATGIYAQQEEKNIDQNLEKSFDALTKEQQEGVLLFAMEQAEMDAKKEFLRLLKNMPDTKKEKLLSFSDNYNREALRYFITKVRPAKYNNANKATAPKPNNSVIAREKQNPSKDRLTAEPSPTSKPLNIERPTGPVVRPDMTTIEFEETEFNFGTIEQGESVSYVFKFKNSGENPLTISNAKGSCGCTVPEWSKEEIAPGEMGEIKVTFNSRGKKGMQSKRVTITANTQPVTTYLFVKGTIEVPAGDK